MQIGRRHLNAAKNKETKIKVRHEFCLSMKRGGMQRPRKDNIISTIIVSVVGVGQKTDQRGQEGSDQVHASDFVVLILPGCVQTFSVTTAHQNSR